MVLCGVHRGHVHHRDVRPDGLLEAEQLCGQSLLQGDDVLLQLRPPGSGESRLTRGPLLQLPRVLDRQGLISSSEVA